MSLIIIIITSSSVSWHSFLFSTSTPCSFRNVHRNKLRFWIKFCSSLLPRLYASRRFVVGGSIYNTMRSTLCTKNIPDIIDFNLKKNNQILIVLGKNISDTIGHQMTVQVSTSANVSSCITVYMSPAFTLKPGLNIKHII